MKTETLDPTVKVKNGKLFIDGEYVDALSGETFESINPSTNEKLASGPLDQRYADTWDTLGPLTQWWYALSKTVGPTPPLAPGMLAQSALLLVLATFASPQRTGVPEETGTRATA